MIKNDFGYTWWGKKWLDSLASVDFSNRLPRGRRYARNGSVRSIDIKNGSVKAKVKGSWMYAVDINAPAFTDKEKKIITDIITGNPLYLSKLLLRQLHEGLYEDLHKSSVELFPRGARDLKTHCSCPDSAVTCKHIAAVLYLIANEIDKNPFMVFELHGFDLPSAIAGSKASLPALINGNIMTGPELLGKIKASKTAGQMQDEDIDLSMIVKNESTPASLLSGEPLFYKIGDFKHVLEKMYLRNEELLSLALASGEREDTAMAAGDYRELGLEIDGNFRLKKAFVIEGGIKLGISESLEIIYMLETIGKTRIADYRGSIRGHHLCMRLARALISKRAYIPAVISTGKDRYVIIWQPAAGDKAISAALDKINRIIPAGSIVMKDEANVKIENRAFAAVIFYLNSMLHSLNADAADDRDDVSNMFFSGDFFQADTFERKEIPGTINSWLERLYIASGSMAPVLKVDGAGKGFTAEIMAEKKEEPGHLVSLAAIMNEEKYGSEREAAIKTAGMLADSMPQMNEHVASGGSLKALITARDFPGIFFGVLPQLKTLGYGVILPKSLDNIIRPRLYMAPVKKKKSSNLKSYFAAGSAYEFEWRVAIGDETMSAADFAVLTRSHDGMVKLRDSYVYLDGKEISTILKQTTRSAALRPGEVIKAALSGSLNGMDMTVAPEILKMIDSLMKTGKTVLPAKLTANLRHYQVRGYEWLYKNAKLCFGSLIADDMGLGKTLQVIALCMKMKEEGAFKNHPGLIVMPTTLLTNWENEIGKFAGSLKVFVYHGNERKFSVKNKDLVLTTYGIVRREIDKFTAVKWPMVAIDEAQNIKNDTAGQSRAVKSIESDIRVAMTGTPVENSLAEYYSISGFLNPGYLGSRDGFIKEYGVPIEAYGDKSAAERFRKITAPFVIRRMKSDKSIIKDLPDKVEMDDYCSLTAGQAAMYKAVIDREMKAIETSSGIERRGKVLQLITELKQVCNHPAQYAKRGGHEPEKSGKAMMLMELLDTIHENGEKTLIFTQYTQMGLLLAQMIKDRFKVEPLFLHGGTARKKRDDYVKSFQTDRQIKVFLLSLKAGGTGLNLTAASNVIHYDLWWNPAVELQATDRAYRIGQNKNVMVHRLISKGTLEEKIDKMIKSKKALADMAVATGEKWIGELSNKDLKDILKLAV